jgi:hypothetical protein
MVNINPKQVGDLVYPQYLVVRTLELASAQAAVKGNLMTTDANGRLTAFTSSTSKITNVQGVFQILADRPARTYTSGDGDTVQVAIATSWVLLKAVADVTAGMRVTLNTPTATTVTANQVKVDPDSSTGGYNLTNYVGRVHSIYTVDASENPKRGKTAAGDLVVVMLGEL